jgi:lipoprotein-releasing system permease protein
LVDLVPFNVPALPTVTSLPVDYNPKFYIIGAIFGTITSYFAGYFPSRKASQIDPVQIIRGK